MGNVPDDASYEALSQLEEALGGAVANGLTAADLAELQVRSPALPMPFSALLLCASADLRRPRRAAGDDAHGGARRGGAALLHLLLRVRRGRSDAHARVQAQLPPRVHRPVARQEDDVPHVQAAGARGGRVGRWRRGLRRPAEGAQGRPQLRMTMRRVAPRLACRELVRSGESIGSHLRHFGWRMLMCARRVPRGCPARVCACPIAIVQSPSHGATPCASCAVGWPSACMGLSSGAPRMSRWARGTAVLTSDGTTALAVRHPKQLRGPCGGLLWHRIQVHFRTRPMKSKQLTSQPRCSRSRSCRSCS